jgi:hypothetical protein
MFWQEAASLENTFLSLSERIKEKAPKRGLKVVGGRL